jgi:hypothetical protein
VTLGSGNNPVNPSINITGSDVAGDLLEVSGGIGTGTINTKGIAVLDLTDTTADGTINVNIKGSLLLHATVSQFFGSLNFIGGSTYLIGTSSFQGTSVLFDTNVEGNGTIDANHGDNGVNSGQYEFAGAVGSGVTVSLEGSGPPESVQIDHPGTFKGLLELPGPGQFTEPLVGSVLFEGLHVTSADLNPNNDVLQMWNGRHLVDTVRLAGDTSNLEVVQTTKGVVLGTNTSIIFGNFGTSIGGNLFH